MDTSSTPSCIGAWVWLIRAVKVVTTEREGERWLEIFYIKCSENHIMSDSLTNDIRQEANTAHLEVDKGL